MPVPELFCEVMSFRKSAGSVFKASHDPVKAGACCVVIDSDLGSFTKHGNQASG